MKRKRQKKESGQAMVEFALLLPVLLLILCGILDFGWLFFNQLSLDNACREGARYACVNSLVDDSDNLVENHITNTMSRIFVNDLDIDVVYSVPGDRVTGDVTVTIETQMNVLTPVLQLFVGGNVETLTSSVTMKVES